MVAKMKRVIKRIPVSERDVAFVQSLQYDADGLRVLCTQFALAGGDVDNPLFAKYQEAQRAFQLGYSELTANYAPEYSGGGFASELNYINNELVIFANE